MANTITPTPSTTGFRVVTIGTGKQYADLAAFAAYFGPLDMVGNAEILCGEWYEPQSPLGVNFATLGGKTNSTYYVIARPVPGLDQAYDGDGVAVTYTNSSAELVFNNTNPCTMTAGGVEFQNCNVRFMGSNTTSHALKTDYFYSNLGSRVAAFRRCRMYVEVASSYAIRSGDHSSQLALEDNITFFAPSCTAALYLNNLSTVIESRNTHVRLSAAGYVGIGSPAGLKDSCVYFGSGGASNNFDSGASMKNCISDNSADARTGVTVVDPTTMFSSSTDYRPKTGGSLIGKASGTSVGTLDLFGKVRPSPANAGAIQRDFMPGLPQGTITSTTVNVATGNKRSVTISGTTTGAPTSGRASITPTSITGNNAVAQTNAVITLGSGTFTVTFSDVKVGQYSKTISLTNATGTSGVSDAAVLDVLGASGVITSQPAPVGQYQSVSGTTTGTPDSGTITWPANVAAANTSNQGPFALTLGSGTFSDISRLLSPGNYDAPIYDFTIAAGTSVRSSTGGSAVFINGISGNPQAPDPSPSSSTVTSVTISPDGVTVQGGSTQQFTVNVQGTNNPSQAVTWAVVSGSGSINSSSGLYTAGAATSSVQPITLRARSIQNGDVYDDVTFTIPASTSTVTSVSISPQVVTVIGLATQQFTASVQGNGSPSQAVTWSKVSGVGSISSTGLYAAPASTGAVQNTVIRATSVQNTTFTQDASITVSATGSTFVAQITIPLKLVSGSAAVSLTGLKWAWHDQATPDLFIGAPTDKGAVETTDSQGNIVIPLPNSKKTASGQIGHIEIMNSDGTLTTPYSAFVGPWAVD